MGHMSMSLNEFLDRFSCPLAYERVLPALDAIQEQNELNKKHMVMDYISMYWDVYSEVPAAEEIQEHFYKIDLDSDMVQQLIKEF